MKKLNFEKKIKKKYLQFCTDQCQSLWRIYIRTVRSRDPGRGRLALAWRRCCQIPCSWRNAGLSDAQYIMPTCNGSVRWKYTLGLLLKVGSTLVYTWPSSGRTIMPAQNTHYHLLRLHAAEQLCRADRIIIDDNTEYYNCASLYPNS